MKFRAILKGTSAIVALAVAAPAFAQDVAQQETPAESASDETAPGEIIVTAQRRSESLQRVPVSLTALTADTLETRRLNDLTQITRAAPSLQVGQDNTFAVRGVGTQSFVGTIDSSVAQSLDDVNLGRPNLAGGLFNDLERVEVLNGPQGLLFGKNASSGLLNIVTVRPKLGEFSGATDVEVSLRETPGADRSAPGVIARQTLNLPVSDNSALRINALYSYQEPPTSYVGTPLPGRRVDLNGRSFAIKAKYLIDITDRLSLYAIADYGENKGVGGIFAPTYRTVAPGSINGPALAADGITPGPRNFLTGGDGGYYRDLGTGGAQAQLSYSFDSGLEISNLFAWRFYDLSQSYDIDALSADGANLNATEARYDQYSNELRVALPAGHRLSGQAGLYYFRSTLEQQNQIGGANYIPSFVLRGYPFCVGAVATPGAPPPTCSVSNQFFLGRDNAYTLDTESYAVFGQIGFQIVDGLQVTAGGRVTRDKIGIDLTQGQGNYFQNLGGPRGTISRRYANTDFSWKLGAQYQMTPAIMFYGFYGKGYKGPGFNDIAATLASPLVVREESSKAAEVGIKSSFFDRRLTINVSAFHTKFDNYQVQSFDPVIRTFQIQNAAKVTSKGLEATVIAAPFAGLTINGSASLLSSKFDSFPLAQCYPTQTTLGCSPTVGTFDAAGMRLPNSPKFTSSLQAQYEFQTSGEVQPFVEGNWYHRSSVSTIGNPPGSLLPAIDVFGASIGARIGSNLRVSIFCKNCTNEISPTSVSTDPGDAAARNNLGQPTPMLTLTQQFGLDSVRSFGFAFGFRF